MRPGQKSPFAPPDVDGPADSYPDAACVSCH